jgi:hypothetical protein
MLYIPRKPSSPSVTFSDFLHSHACRWQFGDEVRARMAAADLKSLPALLKWARERYPDQYRDYHYWNECTGAEATRRLWADFLRWREAL